MDEKCGYKTPTPADSPEQQIIDPSFPKNEREWWASEEITRLRAEVEALRADAERYRWLKGHSAYTTVTPCIHGEANGPSRMRWYHDSHQLHAFTLDAAIDAAIKSGLNSC